MPEGTLCNLCGSASNRPWRLIEGWQLVRCRDCGHIWLPSTSANFQALYDEGYFEGHYFAKSYNEEEITRQVQESKPRIDLLERYAKRGMLLDVGCGLGFFLAAARSTGWSVVGIDLSSYAVKWARERLNLPVICGTLESAPIEPESMDAITFWHSLEHIADPTSAVRTAYRLLKPGGILLVQVPNVASLERHFLRDRWSGWDLPMHLHHFSPRTLRWLAKRAGFRVLGDQYQASMPILNWIRSFTPWPKRSPRAENRGGNAAPNAPVRYLSLKRKTLPILSRLITGRGYTLIAAKAMGA